MQHSIVTALIVLFVFTDASLAQTQKTKVIVGDFSRSQLLAWEAREFIGQTAYKFVRDQDNGQFVLKAEASASASGLFNKTKINLNETPFINWSWKVENIFGDIDESAKSGDDFPARIYVVVERGILGFSSISLNYVWASRNPMQKLWPSPYTDQVMLLAIDSGPERLGTWKHHKRNLRNDLYQAFGENFFEIHATALMTDTDNHGGKAVAYYGNIWFSAE